MQDEKKIQINELAKIKWACRRGMLELDVLLGYFFEEQYSRLTEAEQRQFVDLLEEADPTLFAWLMGHEVPPNRFISLTEKIRQHARSRTAT